MTSTKSKRFRYCAPCLLPRNAPILAVISPNYTDTITVLAGEEETPFTVHKDTICAQSDYFVAVCSKAWTQSQKKERTIPLPDIRPTVFKLYAHWVYAFEIDLDIDDLPNTQPADFDAEEGEGPRHWRDMWHSLVQLYVAADMLLDKSLKNEVIDRLATMMEAHDNGKEGITVEIVTYAWENTASGCGLRRFVLDFVASTISGSGSRGQRDQFSPEFSFDLATRQLELRGLKIGRDTVPGERRKEMYYD